MKAVILAGGMGTRLRPVTGVRPKPMVPLLGKPLMEHIIALLRAQGFEDALCYLSGDTANIIVKTDGLDAAQAAVIKNTLLSEVEVSGDAITIVEVR